MRRCGALRRPRKRQVDVQVSKKLVGGVHSLGSWHSKALEDLAQRDKDLAQPLAHLLQLVDSDLNLLHNSMKRTDNKSNLGVPK